MNAVLCVVPRERRSIKIKSALLINESSTSVMRALNGLIHSSLSHSHIIYIHSLTTLDCNKLNVTSVLLCIFCDIFF